MTIENSKENINDNGAEGEDGVDEELIELDLLQGVMAKIYHGGYAVSEFAVNWSARLQTYIQLVKTPEEDVERKRKKLERFVESKVNELHEDAKSAFGDTFANRYMVLLSIAGNLMRHATHEARRMTNEMGITPPSNPVDEVVSRSASIAGSCGDAGSSSMYKAMMDVGMSQEDAEIFHRQSSACVEVLLREIDERMAKHFEVDGEQPFGKVAATHFMLISAIGERVEQSLELVQRDYLKGKSDGPLKIQQH